MFVSWNKLGIIMSVTVLPFRHPSTILVAGPTGCGKTQFLLRLLTTPNAIQPVPQRVVWVYSEWQPAYDALRSSLSRRIEFVKDYDAEALYDSFNPNARNVLVLDDQMDSSGTRGGTGATTLTKFFTQGSHHRNLTVIYIVQNMFNQDRTMRTVNLNSHFLVLFKNPRDKTQVRTLAQQMYPRNSGFLVDAFEDATALPFSYLVLDLRPETEERLRVRANIFDERGAVVYVPHDSIKSRRGGSRKRK
jgi:energy-coupling factor transporter ATP-binding protein EcfA2